MAANPLPVKKTFSETYLTKRNKRVAKHTTIFLLRVIWALGKGLTSFAAVTLWHFFRIPFVVVGAMFGIRF
ncbi:hypothetical protein [Castellaniella sp.]|uniref:hypothetical protein n=1 Tax=Castellaniella sp. TaxID=1955812 RepID=UPI002AFEB760|nr:hypothetical protein [Castellaniella sp.]